MIIIYLTSLGCLFYWERTENMKITFYSNYLNHHQIPFSNEMFKRFGNDYTFVATTKMDLERKKMGWNVDEIYPYELRSYESGQATELSLKLAEESDVVIVGSASDKYVIKRLKKNKLTFKYGERLYKSGLNLSNLPRAVISSYIHHGKYQKRPLYMLCASGYTAADLDLFGNYKNKTYKWGYFPEGKRYNLNQLFMMKQNETIKILWVGRLIELKHTEYAIKVAKRLKDNGYKFSLDIIGNGEQDAYLKELTAKLDLNNVVTFWNLMKPKEVRELMEKANIFLFTSDFNEGWGAVLNESMNSGCAVVASHAIGSVPFLIDNCNNGLIYKDGDLNSLYNKVKLLMDDEKFRFRIGVNAYHTITKTWSAEIATERLLVLVNELQNHGNCEIFLNGPCSKAEIIKNNWFSN